MSITSASVIAVVGPGEAGTATCDRAEIVGRAVATAGADLVCGGLGGVMEAACRGARSAGGRTIGILPGGERAEANPYVDVVIPTGLGEARNAVVVRAADALIRAAGERSARSPWPQSWTGRSWEWARGGCACRTGRTTGWPAPTIRRRRCLWRCGRWDSARDASSGRFELTAGSPGLTTGRR